MIPQNISKSTIKRLPVYLTYLKSLPQDESVNISATAIASALGMGEVQVRKDLASISDSGKPKVGYKLTDLIHELTHFLRYNDMDDVIIVGAGRLGCALLNYDGFSEYGLNIVAGFDCSVNEPTNTASGKIVYPIENLKSFCTSSNIKIGILAVPVNAAQNVCNQMVDAGIKAVLNFAPIHLSVPDDVVLQNENLAASLAALSNNLSRKIQAEQK